VNEGKRREKIKKLSTRWARRTMSAGRVAASLGGTAVRQVVLGTDGGAAAGELLAERMDELKGVLMKVGQMFSYMDGVLSPEAMDALRSLQSGARTFAFEDVEKLVVDAFEGQPLAELFESFDEEPLAGASIGQVHRARFAGRDVAVKVQYPDILATLEMDLDNASRIGLLAGLGTSVDPVDMMDELRARFREECDYLQEAANTIAFGRLFHDRVRVPDVITERCRRTVLTTELVAGRSLYDVAKDSERERDRVGAALFDTVSRSIFHHAAFNGDPHPGNFFFPAGGDVDVILLDFGCVRYLEREFVERWKVMALSVLDGRRADFPDAIRGVGLVGSRKFDFDAQWEIMRFIYRPFLTPGFRFEGDYVRDVFRMIKYGNANARYTSLPGPWVTANRLLFGVHALLHILRASADWGGMLRHWITAETEPVGKPAPLAVAEGA
jgi:predicted unusual protein kinase regulating ubiquinone biosynthesis (AarF/ABC1/UbiB family)